MLIVLSDEKVFLFVSCGYFHDGDMYGPITISCFLCVWLPESMASG